MKHLLRIEAIAGDTLKDALNLRRSTNKLVIPKVVTRVANEFNESYENTPWMRLQQNKPFHEHSRDLLLNMAMQVNRRLQLRKQEQEHSAGMMSVCIRKSELICKSRKQLKTTFRVQIHG